jgi:hypothetical protein
LVSPFGPGCYELRDGDQYVLFGRGENAALRMKSLLPEPLGSGRRNNSKKRRYVPTHAQTVEYPTIACSSMKKR